MGIWNTLLQLFMLLPCLTALALPNNNASDETENNTRLSLGRAASAGYSSAHCLMAPPGCAALPNKRPGSGGSLRPGRMKAGK